MEVVVVQPRLFMELSGCLDYEEFGFLDGIKALLAVVCVILERLCLREALSIHLLCNEPLGLGFIAVIRVRPSRNE